MRKRTANTPAQDEAVDKLSEIKSGALFMECGSGKTKVAFELIRRRREQIDLVIWIAPACLLRSGNYREELSRWSGDAGRPIHFYSIESLAYNDITFMEMYDRALFSRSFCVVDESLTIKNALAKRTRRLVGSYNIFDFRLILNGTPITRGVVDLYSQMQFLSPGILKMTRSQFINIFMGGKRADGWRWSTYAQEKMLVELIRPYIFDCRLELPVSLKHGYIGVELSRAEHAAYRRRKDDFLAGRGESLKFLSVAQRFQRFYTDCAAKRAAASGLIGEILGRGEKVIVYVKFLTEVAFLRRSFAAECVVLTGKERGSLEEFKKRRNILICTYGVGSMGLNLQFCNNVVYYSQTFDYGLKMQSLYRVYRVGQARDVNIYELWVRNVALERLFLRLQSSKGKTLRNLKEIISRQEARRL